MCVFKAPKVSAPAALPAAPTEQDPTVTASRERERRRQAAALSGSTLLSGGTGVPNPASTSPKTLLGE